MTNTFSINEQVEVKFTGRVVKVERVGDDIAYTVITNKSVAVVTESFLKKVEEKKVIS